MICFISAETMRKKKQKDDKATNWMNGLTFTEVYETIIRIVEKCSDLIWLASKRAGGVSVGERQVIAVAIGFPVIGMTLDVGLRFKIEDKELFVRLACHVEHTIADVDSFAFLKVLIGVGPTHRVFSRPIEAAVMSQMVVVGLPTDEVEVIRDRGAIRIVVEELVKIIVGNRFGEYCI